MVMVVTLHSRGVRLGLSGDLGIQQSEGSSSVCKSWSGPEPEPPGPEASKQKNLMQKDSNP